jgi:hypothetical protein
MVYMEENGATLNKLITLACMPLLFWIYTRIGSDSEQVLFLLIILSLTIASHLLAETEQGNEVNKHHRFSIHSILWINAFVLYGAAIVWNHIFRNEILGHHYTGDIFRQIYWNYWAPIYGYAETPSLNEVLLIVLFSAAIYFAIKIYEKKYIETEPRTILIFIGVLNLLLIIAFALSQSEARLFQNIYDYKSFGADGDLSLFNNLHDVWEKWNLLMPGLHGRNPHYPPGNLFILKIEHLFHVPGLTKGLVITATMLCVPLLYYLGKMLGLSNDLALLAVTLFATSASTTIFPTTSMAAATMFFTLASYLGFFAAIKNNSMRGAVLCGFSLTLYSLMSFSVFIVGLSILIISLIYIISDSTSRINIIKTDIIAGITFLGGLLLLYILTGFNLWSCLAQSIQDNSNIMTVNPFDTPVRYLLRSAGNILAYSIYTGIVLSSLALAGCYRLSRAGLDLRIFISGCLATLIAAGFSGLFFMETERIWVFFTPFLAISAAWGMLSWSNSDNRPEIARLLIITNLLTTSFQEICFKHYWL